MLVLVLVLAIVVPRPAPADAVAASARSGAVHPAGTGSTAPAPAPEDAAGTRRALLARLRFVDHTYCSYLRGSRYPPGSRPMSEHADQNRPNAPVLEAYPMRLAGDGGGGSGATDTAVQLQTSQSRVYLAAGESALLSLRAVDAEGRVLPLVVTRALARGMTYGASRPAPQVALAFADAGGGPDAAASDGSVSAVLAPGQGGLAGFDGTIRTEVRYSAGGRNGVVNFDVIHTPVLPAVWRGPVREAVEDGALRFYLPAEVRIPGRYIVSGRVDDAAGRPLALLTFNDVLGPGPHDIPLAVFGKLLRDGIGEGGAPMPLTLRDVDGYLLRDSGDAGADRALMPRLEGKVHTSRAYAAGGFSDAEWQSDERTRYLTEFARDLALARSALRAFDPALPEPPGACGPRGQDRR
jgi:hypothetical protein